MSTCRWVDAEHPRAITGRHLAACEDDLCRGCQPCTEPHCRVCGIAHANGTCAECLAETRESLHEIARMCGALPDEVEARGIAGEAMFLLGPVADPEARGHLEASVAAGRVSVDYLAEAIGETHPVWILGTWDMLWRDALDHDTAELVTIAEAVDYLDRTMTYMAGYAHLPFEDFARDLRRCYAHLAAVLHDGEQHDRGAPCMTCGEPLERVWGNDDKADGWKCPRCKRTSTEAQYRFAVAHHFLLNAENLTTDQIAETYEIPASTIRRWASRKREFNGTAWIDSEPLLKPSGKADNGRLTYRVSEVLELREGVTA